MSWNVLAACHVRAARYEDVDAALLDAGARRERVIAMIEQLVSAHALDVVALQECDLELWSALSRELSGLDSCWVPKERGKDEGLCTLVRRSSSWELASTERLVFADESGHLAQLARLVQRDGGDREHREEVIVANTHVRWADPATPVDEHIGVGQILELGGRVSEVAERSMSVICGDLNDSPEGPVRRALSSAGWDEVGEGAPTAWIGGRALSLDVIAVGGGSGDEVEVIELGVEATGPLPSLEVPSDHVPIAASVLVATTSTTRATAGT